MPEFKTWRAFQNFEREVSRRQRYVRSRYAEEFLDTVCATCNDRKLKIPKGAFLWRAQEGHVWRHIKEIDDDVPAAFPKSRMTPLRDRAYEGRANPKGIPVVYLSNTKEGAMSEVRPWLGSYVSAGQFQVMRELTVIDCSRYHAARYRFHFSEPTPQEREKTVWTHIDQAFSKPVTRHDDTSDYVATQIIAEKFHDLGYDGVAYKNAFGTRAVNVALFDLDAVEMKSCHLYRVARARFSFDSTGDSYWVSEARKARKTKRSKKP